MKGLGDSQWLSEPKSVRLVPDEVQVWLLGDHIFAIKHDLSV